MLDQMFGDEDSHLGEVMDLATLFDGFSDLRQILLAALTLAWAMRNDLVWMSHLHERPALMTALPTRGLGAEFSTSMMLPLHSIGGRRLATVMAIFAQTSFYRLQPLEKLLIGRS